MLQASGHLIGKNTRCLPLQTRKIIIFFISHMEADHSAPVSSLAKAGKSTSLIQVPIQGILERYYKSTQEKKKKNTSNIV